MLKQIFVPPQSFHRKRDNARPRNSTKRSCSNRGTYEWNSSANTGNRGHNLIRVSGPDVNERVFRSSLGSDWWATKGNDTTSWSTFWTCRNDRSNSARPNRPKIAFRSIYLSAGTIEIEFWICSGGRRSVAGDERIDRTVQQLDGLKSTFFFRLGHDRNRKAVCVCMGRRWDPDVHYSSWIGGREERGNGGRAAIVGVPSNGDLRLSERLSGWCAVRTDDVVRRWWTAFE